MWCTANLDKNQPWIRNRLCMVLATSPSTEITAVTHSVLLLRLYNPTEESPWRLQSRKMERVWNNSTLDRKIIHPFLSVKERKVHYRIIINKTMQTVCRKQRILNRLSTDLLSTFGHHFSPSEMTNAFQQKVRGFIPRLVQTNILIFCLFSYLYFT